MISIIIPAYNAEKTIENCIHSVVNQTYKDLEIIIIDDGSTDNTLAICRKWEKLDKRIKLFHISNGGVSRARNTGIKQSHGDYLSFVDSDDTIGENYIKDLYDAIRLNHTDLSICGYTDVFPNKKLIHCLEDNDMNNLSGFLNLDLFIVRDFINSPCLKIYKRRIIEENSICFPEDMITAEDQFFNFQYYNLIERYSFVNKYDYYYTREYSQLSLKKNELCFNGELRNLSAKEKYFRDHNITHGTLIIAENICYLIRRYLLLDNEELNTFINVRRRLKKLQKHCPKVTIKNFKDNIIYQFVRRRMYFPVYCYYKLKS